MISGIPLVSGLGTRMSEPYVSVVCWAPILCRGLDSCQYGGPVFLDTAAVSGTSSMLKMILAVA